MNTEKERLELLQEASMKVICRLSAWADDAEMRARRLPDSEAEPYRNMWRNYRDLFDTLNNALVNSDTQEVK